MEKRLDTGRFKNLTAEEHDSCGIIATIEKNGVPKRKNMLDTIDAMIKMEHRSGFINGEGDGCGILTDLPRNVWEEHLSAEGLSRKLATDPRFAVAHIFIPKDQEASADLIKEEIREELKKNELQILAEKLDKVNHAVLGKNGRKDEPHFWQVACLAEKTEGFDSLLFDLVIQMEKLHPIHVASFSNHTAVYKLMGAANLLPKYYHDLGHPAFESLVTIGHNRYSTNTLSNFFRVQPFSILGHNGEINTVRKLRDEARMIGAPLAVDSSDSQDLNRLIETLIHHYGYSLLEAIEIAFPPIIHEIKHFPQHLQDLYMYYRQAWGPFAQGPAGIVSRYGQECAFRVDALGLRPLWFIENERSLFFSSEQGILPVHQMVGEPKPLAPGETIGVKLKPEAEVILQHDLQQVVYDRSSQRSDFTKYHHFITTETGRQTEQTKLPLITKSAYAAFGWDRDQIQMVQDMASKGADPIRSLGHDAPLASLSKVRQNIADFIKESVAVVTNPAIDREREMEHFSTRVVLGGRPSLQSQSESAIRVELPSPILVEGQYAKEVQEAFSTLSYEALLKKFAEKVAHLSITYQKETGLQARLDELQAEAIAAVSQGKTILVLDDHGCHQNGQLYMDPHLALSHIDQGLKQAPSTTSAGETLRRETSLVLRSRAIRNLHDIAIAVGLGADGIAPTLMFQSIVTEKEQTASHLYDAINKGLEKIFSTIGIHELRGYARLFSSIGLSDSVANVLSIVNFCGSDSAGFDWNALEQDAEARYEDFANEKAKEARLFRLWPRIWKPIGQIATGELTYEEFTAKINKLETENPTSIRHLTDLKQTERSPVSPEEVDLSVGDHDLPMVISSMSFGSQGEIAFRAYAEAADRLNMVSMNGEGGEIKDMLGKYPRTRGHQIASGRFGVNVELANSANILEIKIGQGAKPGEGGHLPGKKVSEKVAAARNATPGSDLISPSNNHDIYSIEDLAQMITELKTANRRAKVIVKVPIVPNIGTISVGIAKAGADIITLSGFDGGTGAARIHALQHVGLPVEIGVKAAHQALIEAGIRDQVEIWADGGLKSSLDVIKVMMLGANRIGFATLAMIAIGCTSCRGCHLDTCHVGIATQIETTEEAKDHGLRRFIPREQDLAIENLMRLFSTFGDELKKLTAQLGFTRTQDIVGRSDLLEQTRGLDQLDLTDLLDNTQQKTVQAAMQAAHIAQEQVAAGAEGIQIEELNFEQPISKSFSQVNSTHRVMISNVSGARVHNRLDGSYHSLPKAEYRLTHGSIPGNGFTAYHADGINVSVDGGAQDGVGKTAFGGRVAILKSPNRHQTYINGSVGKGFCYGAQKGLFIVQGDADSRAGIRLSGADIIIGGEIKEPLRDELAMIASRANIKGFGFEYMTEGRAMVLGDPGPWICSGMTGGVVYIRLQPDLGLDEVAIQRRIAKSAKVSIQSLGEQGLQDVEELLTAYKDTLVQAKQFTAAEKINTLLSEAQQQFIQIIPDKQQADPNISTE